VVRHGFLPLQLRAAHYARACEDPSGPGDHLRCGASWRYCLCWCHDYATISAELLEGL
jgi:hypothetical protein